MAGARTAAVWTIGAATLATPVGQTSLGNYIFSGLQTENWVFVLFGCAASAVLALATDQLLGLVESGLTARRPWRIWAGGLGLLAGALAALAPLTGEAKRTPSSAIFLIAPRLNTWKPPESVRMGRSQPMKRCRPPCARITSRPGRSQR